MRVARILHRISIPSGSESSVDPSESIFFSCSQIFLRINRAVYSFDLCASGGFRPGHQDEHLLKRTLSESPRVMRAWPIFWRPSKPPPLGRQSSWIPPCSRGSRHSVASGPYAGKSGEVFINPAYATCTRGCQQLSAVRCLDAGSSTTAKHRAQIFGHVATHARHLAVDTMHHSTWLHHTISERATPF